MGVVPLEDIITNDDDKRWYVYMHINKINDKKYIGITSMDPPAKRWNYGFGYQNSKHFWNAIQKYGWNNFKHEILFAGLTKQEACDKEIELIALYDTTNQDMGYNVAPGGNLPTVTWTDEMKQHLREVNTGRRLSEETRQKMSLSRIGISLTEETKQKLREINLGENNPNFGLKRSEETKRKISEARRGQPSNNPLGKHGERKYIDENGKWLCDPIYQYTKDGIMVDKFFTAKHASEKTGIGRSSIANCLCGLSKTAGGYVWKKENELSV